VTDRERVLAALRRPAATGPALPPAWSPTAAGADLEARFSASLAAAAGRAILVADEAALERELAALEAELGVGRDHVACGELLAGLDRGAAADPELELAVVRGEFAVAETGAVWVTERALARRAPLFLARHLVLVVPRAALVADLHAAFERIAGDPTPGFGVLVAGPSKTADIERTLVVGAHGATTTSVLLVGSPA
jgi:L-lactate dehydrogenase complex protein LldG